MDAERRARQDAGLAFLDTLFAFDLDALRAKLTDDIEWWMVGATPASGLYVGKQQVFEEFLPKLPPGFKPGTGFSLEVHNVVTGDRDVVVECSASATTAAGDHYLNRYVYVLELRDGLVRRVRNYIDTAYAMGMLWSTQAVAPTFGTA
jgi:ketosteroid isomerase-like protein